jgi:hypothetical protein
MHYLYQKDERALPGNLQNRKYSFLLPTLPKSSVSHYFTAFFLFFFSLNELVVGQSPTVKNVSTDAGNIVGNCDQATASEHTAD